MRTQLRVRGLQDIINDGRPGHQSRVSMINKIAQLEREKERIAQERANWQEKIDLIDARLTQIGKVEKRLQELLAEQQVEACSPASGAKRATRTIRADVPFGEVTTIRY